MKLLASGVVRAGMSKAGAIAWIRTQTSGVTPEAARQRLVEMVETELMCLHPGNIARYALRPSEFDRWQEGWR